MSEMSYQTEHQQEQGEITTNGDGAPATVQKEQWKESLFGCFSDLPSCCLGTFFFCYLYGRNANRLDGSDCLYHCCIYFACTTCFVVTTCICCNCVHGPRRKLLREKYNLKPNCADGLVTCLCPLCAICQETREMERRGPPPTIKMIDI